MPDPDEFTAVTELQALAERLADLGRHLDLPVAGRDPVPDVLARTATRRPPAVRYERRRRGRRRLVAVWVLAAMLLAAVTPAGQAAVARVLQVFGVVVRIEPAPSRTGSPPTSQAEHLPGEKALALAQARQQVAFPVVVPALLGEPDRVTVSDAGRVLSLIYDAAPGRPAAGAEGVSARLDEFDGELEPAFLKQTAGDAEFVQLPGDVMAIWVAGPHLVSYLDRSGATHTEAAHQARHTLIWAVGRVTLRLEGDFTREQAVAIAAQTLTGSPSPSG